MNKKIISLLLTAGILGAFGGNTVMSFCSAETENAPITAETETMTEEKLRELLPRTMSEFSKFTAKNGTVSVFGRYIVYCDEINYSTGAEIIMEQVGTAEVKKAFGYDIKPNELPAPGDPGYTVIVYEAISSGTVEITISQGQPWAWEESHEVRDLGYYEVDEEMNVSEISTETMTEEKLRKLLPKTMAEFNEFTKKNGTVSVYGRYIVYCDEINYSTGAAVVMEQVGTAEVKKAFEYDITPDDLTMIGDGDPSHTVIVYEAISSGTVEITISQGQPWSWEQSHKVKDLGYYKVDEEMNVSKISKEEFTPPVRGDVNGDGEFTVADLVMLEKWLLGNGELTCWKNADLSEDSEIDVYDLCVMRKEVSESKPDYTVLNVEVVRGLGSIEKIQKGIYTASSMSELYTVLKTAELCEYDGCKCAFHDVQTLVPNGIDESFFENNVLIAVYNRAGGGNRVLTIDKIEKSSDLLTVYTTTKSPEFETPDMAYYKGFIAVSKTYFEGVSKVERKDTELHILP